MEMKRKYNYLIAILSGVLLWLGWPPLPFFPLLFIGFIPILWLEEECTASNRSAKKFFGLSYIALLVWNLLTTWWVGATYFGTKDISTAIAGLIANTANPLLMCLPLLGFHRTKKRLGSTWGYISLIAYWTTFEFIHLRWDLSWPWLTLGNGFAQHPAVVQWYEFTGVLGGTVWILITNILLYLLLKHLIRRRQEQPENKFVQQHIFRSLAVIAIPTSISFLIYFSYHENGVPKQVVIIQPNIDPYNEKFDPAALDRQLEVLIDLSKKTVDQQTDYLVWPETAIPQGIFINDLSTDETISKVKSFLVAYPKLKLITGISAYQRYDTEKTATARYVPNANFWFDAYNSAIQIDSSANIPIYHKSKLVPGVEQMPYPQLFKFLEPLAIQMGGISGSLAKQSYRGVFFGPDSIGVAPMICYESVYGDYSTDYVKRGADLFFVITNDGWWGNTAGYKQHLQYGRLRAVEMRKDLAQSANTGLSAFVNQRGDLLKVTSWWTPAAIKTMMYANKKITFYTTYGDYIGRIAIILTIIIALYAFIQRFRTKRKLPLSEMIHESELKM